MAKEKRAYRILNFESEKLDRIESSMSWNALKEHLEPIASAYSKIKNDVENTLAKAGSPTPHVNKGCSWEDMNNLSCGVAWIHNFRIKSGGYIMRQGFINNALSKNIPMKFKKLTTVEYGPSDKELMQIERNLSIRKYYNTLKK